MVGTRSTIDRGYSYALQRAEVTHNAVRWPSAGSEKVFLDRVLVPPNDLRAAAHHFDLTQLPFDAEFMLDRVGHFGFIAPSMASIRVEYRTVPDCGLVTVGAGLGSHSFGFRQPMGAVARGGRDLHWRDHKGRLVRSTRVEKVQHAQPTTSYASHDA